MHTNHVHYNNDPEVVFFVLYSCCYREMQSVLFAALLVHVSWSSSSVPACTSGDYSHLDSDFAEHYWVCLQNSSTMAGATACIRGAYPDYDLTSSTCRNCVSKVFLGTSSFPCITACRTDAGSDECIACRDPITAKWPSCLTSGTEAVSLTAAVRIIALLLVVL